MGVALTAHGASAASQVVVDPTTVTLAATGSGLATATVSITVTGSRPVGVSARAADAACSVATLPQSLAAGKPTDVTLALGAGCDTTKSNTLTLRFAGAVPPTMRVTANPPPASPRWRIVVRSFVAAFALALAIGALVSFRMFFYDRAKPPGSGDATTLEPKAEAKGRGPVPAGTYEYSLTTGTRPGWRPWLKESGHGPVGSTVATESSQIEVTIPAAEETGVVERRVYRRLKDDGEFRRVAEVRGSDKTTITDGWLPIHPGTPLTALGTNWSFKDSWLGNVTIGSTVLIALFAGSDTLGAVVGAAAKPTLTAMAVASAVAAIFVTLGPLVVKLVGTDINIPTAGGTIGAGLVTLVGAFGQDIALTWLAYHLADTSAWYIRAGIATVGVVFGVIVFWYATRALWYFLKTGAQWVPSSESDTMKAATKVAAAIEALAAAEATRAAADAQRAAQAVKEAADAPDEVKKRAVEALEAANNAHEAATAAAAAVQEQVEAFAKAEAAPLQPTQAALL